ncbi:hypothetical protein E1267_09030 [Nonomuraea longispora]|uniref:FtsX extracellular domain-containing protein n=1 Tax=Nonomuraea longispora TaxID=1848320 RepID=A0A4R4NM44_9ACTN|nr:permease-like cell division protein FtsX [Nonomuraea longispora]TDC08840.1 hypothetical protein E1267_09030 [Nonomuraea longispora]
MNHGSTEDRLRAALTEAGATLDPGTLRPLRAPERRFRPNYRLVAAAVAVVLAGTATAAVLGGPGDVANIVATSTQTLPDEETDLAVILCTESARKDPCRGRAASPEQTRMIEETIRRSSDVEVVTFESQEVAYGRFRQEYAENKALLAAVKPADMPPSFRVKVKEGTDLRQTFRLLPTLPGVAKFSDPARLFELPVMKGEVQRIAVFLCGKGSALPACGGQRTTERVTKEGKAATEAEMKAIEKLIAKMPEVESYVFEDQEAAYKNFRDSYKSNEQLLEATKVEDMPESFRLTMRPGTERVHVIGELERQPGVAQVLDQTCVREQAALAKYGLDLPEADVCSKGR